ncbi:MAG: DUF2304 domain-containing protein [Anaerolineae bacterium]|jgi:hypothetical protein
MSRTQIIIIGSGVALLLLVLEMVRRRRLREEYSWLWLLTALVYLAIALWPRLAEWVAIAIGAERATSAFAFLGLLFLFLISIQFSMQISRLTEQNKDLAQQLAILDSDVRRLTEIVEGAEEPEDAAAGGGAVDVEHAPRDIPPADVQAGYLSAARVVGD